MTEPTTTPNGDTEMDAVLSALQGTTADARRGIYAQLRRDLSETLDNIDPPITLREKLNRQKLLETRILKVERSALGELFSGSLLPRSDTVPAQAEAATPDAPEHEFEETVVRVSLEKEVESA